MMDTEAASGGTARAGTVRNYWLAQTVEFIRHHFEPAQRDRLQQSFSGPLRKTLASGNLGSWSPRQHQVELLRAIVGTAATDADALARLSECGAFIEKHVSNRISSLLFQIMTPEMLLRRLQAFWERDHEHRQGRCECEITDAGRTAVIRLCDISGYEYIGPVWMGWTRSALSSLTRTDAKASTEGFTRANVGGDVFQFEVVW